MSDANRYSAKRGFGLARRIWGGFRLVSQTLASNDLAQQTPSLPGTARRPTRFRRGAAKSKFLADSQIPSRQTAGSVSRTLRLAGTHWPLMARRQITASTAPAPPSTAHGGLGGAERDACGGPIGPGFDRTGFSHVVVRRARARPPHSPAPPDARPVSGAAR